LFELLLSCGAEPATSQASHNIPAAHTSAIQRLLKIVLVFIGIMRRTIARRL
jgi:hypothetical protein